MDRYDVIIIGSGAGGGTLARSLAPSGKRILLLERGGGGSRAAAKKLLAERRLQHRELAFGGGLRQQPIRVGGHLVRRAGPSIPAPGALLRGRRDEAVRRGALPASRRG